MPNTRCVPSWICGALVALLALPLQAADWIWSSDKPQEVETAYLRRTFVLPENLVGVGEAKLAITADNSYVLFVNGRRVSSDAGDWQTAEVYDIRKALMAGENAIAVEATNNGGPAAAMISFKLKVGDRELDLSSGKDWLAKNALEAGWTRPGKLNWPAAHVFGPVGATAPWGQVAIAKDAIALADVAEKKGRKTPFTLEDGDSVVFLGGTFIERAQRYGWLETELQARYPDRKLRFRNLGWSADTTLSESRGIFDAPAQGYARMLQQLRDIKPSVIVVNYGANESFGGESGIPKFVTQYEKLLSDLAATNADLVLMTPHTHLEMPAPLPKPDARNRNLHLYGDAVRAVAESRSLPVVDLLKVDWRGIKPTDVSDNGLHFNSQGNRVVASQIPALWFGTSVIRSIKIGGPTQAVVTGGAVSSVKAGAESVTFTWQTPLTSAKGVETQIAGLKDGTYAVTVDGQQVAKATAAELAKGLAIPLSGPKQLAAMETLRQKVIEKDTMYFHRWRPQNVTYLFLFRKHEQGNNAKEVEEFELIVSKLDAEIHQLKQPPSQAVEVRKIAAQKRAH